MKIKKIEGLSSYLFGEDGSVQDLIGNKIQLWKDGFKLKTDEVITVKGGIKMNIVRRFQPEDLKKMFDGPKASNYNQAPTAFEKAIESHLQSEPPVAPSGHVLNVTYTDTDKKAASKRVVKKNPKAKKATIKKVGKAIQEAGQSVPPVAGTLPDGFTYPYILINGTPYQSARKASAAGNGSVNTVLKKAKANTDGFHYIEK